MPQLDFFTVKAQLFCLLLSIFLIYTLLLKYAMPAYDVFLRLKIKKITFYRLGVENLFYLSLKFKNNTLQYINFIALCVNDFTKIYCNFLSTVFPFAYYVSISRKNLLNEKTEKPLLNVLLNLARPSNKDIFLLNRKKLRIEDFKKN